MYGVNIWAEKGIVLRNFIIYFQLMFVLAKHNQGLLVPSGVWPFLTKSNQLFGTDSRAAE
jgi:hypothetical protein